MTEADASPGSNGVAVATPAGRQRLLLVLCGAFFLDVLGTTSVFAASPAIGTSLTLDATGMQWIFTAATLPGGAVLLVGGNLADRYGGRRMFLLGLLVFTAASLGCAVTDLFAVLVICRVAQGIAAGIFVPAALAVLIATFTVDVERTKALAVWSTVSGVGATAGLLLGGLLSGVIGWRWVFLVNVPAGAVLALAAIRFLSGLLALAVAGVCFAVMAAAGGRSRHRGRPQPRRSASVIPSGWPSGHSVNSIR